MTEQPFVSVVITALNGEQHIGQCLRSILDQTYQSIEILIADDASEDRTLEIVGEFADPRVRILPAVGVRLGLHQNWTRAIAAAKGKYVKLVCHDDVLMPTCLSIQVEMLEQNVDAVLASGRRQIIDDRGRILIKARGLNHLVSEHGSQIKNGGLLARACVRAGTNLLGEPASVLIRRSSLPDPLFDTRWRYGIDLEFYFRCIRFLSAVVDNRVVCGFRVSHNQLSARLALDQATEMKALLRELADRYPNDVHKRDVQKGVLHSRINALERRVLYRYLKRLGASNAKRANTAHKFLRNRSSPQT